MRKHFTSGARRFADSFTRVVSQQKGRASIFSLAALCITALLIWPAIRSRTASAALQDPPATSPLRGQSPEEVQRKSAGCISCHTATDEPTMHPTKTVQLACTDCHGGNSTVSAPAGSAATSPDYLAAKQKAHVQPRNSAFRNRSAIPERAFTQWLAESYEYIKFVNPGDLRVAPETCGSAGCHASETRAVSTSMMTHARHALGRRALQQRRLTPPKIPASAKATTATANRNR